MSAVRAEVGRAVRSLWRTPGPTAGTVAALALGIGATTAVFGVADAVLLRPLPYADAARLVVLDGQFLALGMRDLGASPPELLDYRARARSFDAIAAFSRFDVNLSGGGEPERVAAARVSSDLLPMLGAVPAPGRALAAADEDPGREGVAILSWGLWQRRFGGAPGVVGRSIALDGRPYTIVGVAPRGLAFPPPGARFGGPADVFVPLALSADERADRSRYSLAVIARLRPEVTLSAAGGEMADLARVLEREYPRSYRGPGGEDGGWRVTVTPLHEAVVGSSGRSVTVLFAAVVVLLLIACVDAAHLLLARAVAQRRALAVRFALGASRARLVRELLAESAVLAVAGGALGALAAAWGTRWLAQAGGPLPRLDEVSLDARALAFAATLSLAVAVLAGLVPALQATAGDLADALAEGGRSASAGRGGVRARRALVVSELALAVLLLTGAGLLLRSFMRLRAVSPGFSSDGVLTLEVSLSPTAYADPARRAALLSRIREGVQALPGVRAAAVASRLPLTGPGLSGPFSIEGRAFDPNAPVPQFAVFRAVSPEYHKALGVPLRQGRPLQASDGAGAPAVAVVNETLARAFFPRGDAIGHRVKLGAPGAPRPWLTIVGVTADVRDRGLALSASPEVTAPLAQDPPSSAVIVARTAGDPLALVGAARQAVWAADPDQPVTRVRTLAQLVADSIVERRAPALLLAVLATLAATLAGLGTYGVMSYIVSGRAHEIGVRMALGARPGDVARVVVGQGLALAAVGAAAGLLAAGALARTLSALLFEVRPVDPATYAGAAGALVAVAAAACARPALRAARVDPAVALREE